MNAIKKLLTQLIAYPSVTPDDEHCQEFMMAYLTHLGFTCLKLNQAPVANFFAYYGTSGPMLVFAGHTDVVPLGDEQQWKTPPFTLTEDQGMLYGRGTADMKGSLACMLVMAERFIKAYPKFQGRLGFLITSGEEGDHYNLGTPYVMKHLAEQGIHIDYCIVGEPSSTQHVGDVIKVGRRGSLNAQMTIQGVQGHVAYPHLADNPIHKLSPALAQLTSTKWDEGNEYFPPTSMQITHIHSGGHASNIIPNQLVLHLNFRYSTEHSDHSLKEQVHALFTQHQIQANIEWRLSGQPFLTSKGALLESCKQAILKTTGIQTELSTSGGTSDGRFIAPYGVEVIELGPVNATIHQINECVALKDLELLEQIYFSVCEQLLTA
jgi:succinyl-diaminopimelate desuccinylase